MKKVIYTALVAMALAILVPAVSFAQAPAGGGGAPTAGAPTAPTPAPVPAPVPAAPTPAPVPAPVPVIPVLAAPVPDNRFRNGVWVGIVGTLFAVLVVSCAYLLMYYLRLTETINVAYASREDAPLTLLKPAIPVPPTTPSANPTAPAPSVPQPPKSIDDCLGGPEAKLASTVLNCCNSMIDRTTRGECLATMISLLKK